MAMPQRDVWIDELNKTDALLQFALMHDDHEEAERLRAKLRRLSGLGEDGGTGGTDPTSLMRLLHGPRLSRLAADPLNPNQHTQSSPRISDGGIRTHPRRSS